MGAAVLELDRFDPVPLRESLERDGYAVGKAMVPKELIADIRAHWHQELSKPRGDSALIWGPYFGEPNKIIRDKSTTHTMVRAFDMLWNQPMHAPTRSLCLALSRFRNQVAGVFSHDSELMTPERYGAYVTVTLYPPNEGWLVEHEDGVPNRRHWHFLVPLTFRGPDFKDGGLYMIDRHGNRIDVEQHVEAGDVLFFDANLRHGVDRIVGHDGSDVGRMQCFSIPTILELPHGNDRLLELISTKRFVKSRLRMVRDRLFGKPTNTHSGFYTYRK